ncbi:hypothetical protein GGR53DRAFT_521933 [Hypoxylon sp. FL1150]|nr:hypothetical protein GGR53DRAFT_521933 [Hypoxylon sp. FL1150]
MADRIVPGSSDTQMEGHSRPAKMAALTFGHPHDPALEHMGMNFTLPTTRHQAGSRGLDDRLALWYHRNDGPWEPPNLQGDGRTPSVLNFRNGQPWLNSQYRESIVPSECDTVPPGVLPSDSGYGSYGAKHSVTNGSVCDESLDRNPETQSLVGHISELNFRSFNQDIMSKGGASPLGSWHQPQPQPSLLSAADRQGNYAGYHVCKTCNKSLKTKSEFKKHKQRHDKPFKCDVPGCTRPDGFSTPNDLDRHKRSLHPDEKATGNRYRCPIGPCKSKDKIWPRADNFRAHMRRVHQKVSLSDDELEHYKIGASPKEIADLLRGSTAPGFDQFTGFSIGNTRHGPTGWETHRNPVMEISAASSPQEIPRQIRVDETPLVNKPGNEERFHLPDSLATHGMRLENDNVSFRQPGVSRATSTRPNSTLDDSQFSHPVQLEEGNATAEPASQDSTLTNGPSSLEYDRINKLDPSQAFPVSSLLGSSPESPQSARQPIELTPIDEKAHTSPEPKNTQTIDVEGLDLTDSEVLKLLRRLQSSGVLEKFGYKKEDPVRSEDTQQEPTNSNTTGEHRHTCFRCNKGFGRRCELKKHEKRHIKPKFGSKNDWKRHENSQHYMVEHWRCDEKSTDNPSEVCGKVVQRRELFKQHLDLSHHVTDQVALDRKLETCRVGRACDTRFWCGFCLRIIEIEKPNVNPWTERFNHIDDHFHGRGGQEKREIHDWREEDPPRPSAASAANDSEDASAAWSTPASSSVNDSDVSRPEKLRVRSESSKRKRDDATDAHISKRATPSQIPSQLRFHCTMPDISGQCNYPCEHRLCDNCPLSR